MQSRHAQVRRLSRRESDFVKEDIRHYKLQIRCRREGHNNSPIVALYLKESEGSLSKNFNRLFC
jgi:hypothetical protein